MALHYRTGPIYDVRCAVSPFPPLPSSYDANVLVAISNIVDAQISVLERLNGADELQTLIRGASHRLNDLDQSVDCMRRQLAELRLAVLGGDVPYESVDNHVDATVVDTQDTAIVDHQDAGGSDTDWSGAFTVDLVCVLCDMLCVAVCVFLVWIG